MALGVVLSTGVSSCGSQRQASTASAAHSPKKSGNRHKTPERSTRQTKTHIKMDQAALNPITLQLLKEADKWLGTPYSWGGNDRNGVDCSGFVTQVYLRSLEISLPRTSERQMQYCKPIEKKDLIPGDLVFFTVRGGKRVGHVGIYIGNGDMVHASSSKGVVITPLSNPYFVTNYYSSGRVERYMALMDKKAPGNKTPSKVKQAHTPEKPLMAKAENNKKSITGKKKDTPKTNNNMSGAAKPSAKPKSVKKTQDKLTTPMPSQVFASNKSITDTSRKTPSKPATTPSGEPEEEETDPEFFD